MEENENMEENNENRKRKLVKSIAFPVVIVLLIVLLILNLVQKKEPEDLEETVKELKEIVEDQHKTMLEIQTTMNQFIWDYTAQTWERQHICETISFEYVDWDPNTREFEVQVTVRLDGIPSSANVCIGTATESYTLEQEGALNTAILSLRGEEAIDEWILSAEHNGESYKEYLGEFPLADVLSSAFSCDVVTDFYEISNELLTIDGTMNYSFPEDFGVVSGIFVYKNAQGECETIPLDCSHSEGMIAVSKSYHPYLEGTTIYMEYTLGDGETVRIQPDLKTVETNDGLYSQSYRISFYGSKGDLLFTL